MAAAPTRATAPAAHAHVSTSSACSPCTELPTPWQHQVAKCSQLYFLWLYGTTLSTARAPAAAPSESRQLALAVREELPTPREVLHGLDLYHALVRALLVALEMDDAVLIEEHGVTVLDLTPKPLSQLADVDPVMSILRLRAH
eukprot:CAMPEP_0196728316 /NCGR_PEP_ID=MMETSP1091-20130531/9018_1 /TAXON_ID=302021 /ORGANISM="Rhodomonas sp., Strain CCMP768" /LENGTH=142 /DNA_ID=CAMNT_0042071041 /DNA_START=136 /DNA_END=566 /DNA_ORIENTATION=+